MSGCFKSLELGCQQEISKAMLAAVLKKTKERETRKTQTKTREKMWLWLQVTVSTVGLVPQLRHFVQNSPAQLAVSLHATTDEVCHCCLPTCLECFIIFGCNACTTLYITNYHDRLLTLA